MKVLKYLLLSIVSSVILATLASRLSGPWLEKKFQEKLKVVCASCEFHTSGFSLAWSGIKLNDVRFSAGAKNNQRIEIHVPQIVIHLNLKTLLPGPVQVTDIGFMQPQMKLLDASQKPTPNQGSYFLIPKLPPLVIADGQFTYVRDVARTHAELTIQPINGRIETKENSAKAQLAAKIGQKGNLALTVDANTGNQTLEIMVDLRATDQDFKELSKFFEPNAGVKLEGTLVSGHAVSKMSGNKVSTTLLAGFKDFKLNVNPMYDRNDIQTFFTNLAANIALKEKNVDRPRSEKIEAVDAEREPGESIVSFILRSWKLAALKVAQ